MATDPQYRPPTLAGIAAMMAGADSFTDEVAALLAYIGDQHEHPVTCRDCQTTDADGPCLVHQMATAVGIAWLMQRVDR